MNTQLLTSIDRVYQQSSIHNFKTLEQCLETFEKEVKIISQIFEIDDLEALFLIAIIINNTEYRICRLEDIADKVEISRFEILKNLNVLFSLQTKNLIEINDYEETNSETKRYLNRITDPVQMMNKSIKISKSLENKLFDI